MGGLCLAGLMLAASQHQPNLDRLAKIDRRPEIEQLRATDLRQGEHLVKALTGENW